MANVCDVVETMEKWAPAFLAESWDNAGLITGDPDNKVTSVIIALDVTEETIALAKKHRASMIVSHHPPIFKPLKNLTGSDQSSKVIRTAIKEDISLYASHSNLDRAPNGVSHALAEKLGLVDTFPLVQDSCTLLKFVAFVPPEYTDKIREAAGNAGAGIIGEYHLCSFTSSGTGTYIPSSDSSPYEGKSGKLSRVTEDRIEMIVPAESAANVVKETRKAHPYDEMAYDLIPLSQQEPTIGYGAVGSLQKPMKLPQFIEHVSKSLSIETLKVSNCEKKLIKNVAMMGGSGSDYISSAISAGADSYITSEMDHHDFLENGSSILLIDASHRATELPILNKIKERLTASPSLEDIDIIIDWGNPHQTVFEYNVEKIN